MDTVTLILKTQPELFLETDNITPDVLAGKSTAEIKALHVFEGRVQHTIGDFFDVSGEPGKTAAETEVVVKGNLSRIKYLGMKMSAGEMRIEGNPDMYTGAWMQGGKLTVKGNTGHFAGIGMRGGEFTVEGNAGSYLGAAYRGDWRGMQGGKLLVHGNAGSDIGTFMNGGEIIVNGDADVHVGTHMEGGTIIVKGNAKSKIGGQMVEGTIYIFGNIEVMMPGFKYSGDADIEVDGVKGKFATYLGDTGERHRKKKGEIIYGKLYRKLA